MYFNIVEYPSCQRTIRIESTQSAWHIISREAIFQAWLIKSIFCRQNIIMLSESHIYRFSLYPGKKFPLQTCIRFSPVVLFLSISVRSIFARARLLYGICSSPVFAAFIRIFLRFVVGVLLVKQDFFNIKTYSLYCNDVNFDENSLCKNLPLKQYNFKPAQRN